MKPFLPNLSAATLALNREVLAGIPHPKTVNAAAILAPARPVKPERKVMHAPRRQIDATAFFAASGLPPVTREFRFNPERKWRLDYAWPAQQVALEVEGAVWIQGRHTRGSGFVKDMEKYNRLATMGWVLLRVQPRDLMTQATVKMVLEAMG